MKKYKFSEIDKKNYYLKMSYKRNCIEYFLKILRKCGKRIVKYSEFKDFPQYKLDMELNERYYYNLMNGFLTEVYKQKDKMEDWCVSFIEKTVIYEPNIIDKYSDAFQMGVLAGFSLDLEKKDKYKFEDALIMIEDINNLVLENKEKDKQKILS